MSSTWHTLKRVVAQQARLIQLRKQRPVPPARATHASAIHQFRRSGDAVAPQQAVVAQLALVLARRGQPMRGAARILNRVGGGALLAGQRVDARAGGHESRRRGVDDPGGSPATGGGVRANPGSKDLILVDEAELILSVRCFEEGIMQVGVFGLFNRGRQVGYQRRLDEGSRRRVPRFLHDIWEEVWVRREACCGWVDPDERF